MLSEFYSDPVIFILLLFAILISLTVHEFSHAFAAHKLGDDTAKFLGRLSLNPKAHLDLMGSLAFLLFGFGWGKPVPVNKFLLKNPKRDLMIVALAGPLSNLVLVIITGLVLKVALAFFAINNFLIIFLLLCFQLNVILMVFNLIPLPPLDGYNILSYLIPDKYRPFYVRYGYYMFFALIFVSIVSDIPIFFWIGHVVSFFANIFSLSILF